LTNAEVNNSSQSISAFTSDGFTTGTANPANESASTTKGFMSWNWKAGTGAGSSNTDGSINTTSTSVNSTAGFSISTYTGTGSNATVGHGLNAVVKFIILKNRTTGRNWQILHHKNTASPATQQLEFITDATATVTSQWNSVMPTNSVFSIGTNDSTNKSGDSFVAYCFAEKQGYSKFGSYTGNGNADGVFVYTGFKPAWLMIKRTDSSSGSNWLMLDSTRSDTNAVNENLAANLSDTETSTDRCDFLSNGFKLRQSGSTVNSSGATYIYMAFGQSLVGSNNIPATAR